MPKQITKSVNQTPQNDDYLKESPSAEQREFNKKLNITKKVHKYSINSYKMDKILQRHLNNVLQAKEKAKIEYKCQQCGKIMRGRNKYAGHFNKNSICKSDQGAKKKEEKVEDDDKKLFEVLAKYDN